MPHTLDYLIFDYSEDDADCATWDAMATVTAERMAAVTAEVQQVLQWAHRKFPHQCGALDEGAAWGYDLSLSCDSGSAAGRMLAIEAEGTPPVVRHAPLPAGSTWTLTFTLTGTAMFADAFSRAFALE